MKINFWNAQSPLVVTGGLYCVIIAQASGNSTKRTRAMLRSNPERDKLIHVQPYKVVAPILIALSQIGAFLNKMTMNIEMYFPKQTTYSCDYPDPLNPTIMAESSNKMVLEKGKPMRRFNSMEEVTTFVNQAVEKQGCTVKDISFDAFNEREKVVHLHFYTARKDFRHSTYFLTVSES